VLGDYRTAAQLSPQKGMREGSATSALTQVKHRSFCALDCCFPYLPAEKSTPQALSIMQGLQEWWVAGARASSTPVRCLGEPRRVVLPASALQRLFSIPRNYSHSLETLENRVASRKAAAASCHRPSGKTPCFCARAAPALPQGEGARKLRQRGARVPTPSIPRPVKNRRWLEEFRSTMPTSAADADTLGMRPEMNNRLLRVRLSRAALGQREGVPAHAATEWYDSVESFSSVRLARSHVQERGQALFRNAMKRQVLSKIPGLPPEGVEHASDSPDRNRALDRHVAGF